MITKLRQPRASWFSKYVPLAGSGCVLFYPGQDDPQSLLIKDISGKGNHGTVTGATYKREPKGIQVLDLDGIDDEISIGNDSSLQISGDITVMAWVKLGILSSTKGAVQQIFKKLDRTNNGYDLVFWTNDRLYFRAFRGGSSAEPDVDISSGYIDTWKFIVGRVSGSDVRLYVDGVSVSSGTLVNGVADSGSTLYIGGPANFKGRIYQAKLLNKAISTTLIPFFYRQERNQLGV